MCQAAALLAARHLPQWEILRLRRRGKPDVPSGTARELAERLGEIRTPQTGRPSRSSSGRARPAARGGGTRCTPCACPASSSRRRSSSACPTSALTIRHDAGATPEPYVAGTLVAVRRAPRLTGRGARVDTLAVLAES
jgi:4-hydroxy-tetrahydrodipicolinate reductase